MKKPAGRRFCIVRERGVSWLKDPSGRRMFYASVQCVSPRHGSRVPGAPAYDGIAAAGGLAKWVRRTEARLRTWGFKGLGAWNHRLWHYRELPFTESLNIWKSMRVKGGIKPIFDPDWEIQVEKKIAPQIRSLRDCPNLIGYFLDNEIRWSLDWIYFYFNGRPAGDPNRRAVLAFLRKRYRSIGRLNAAWGTRLSGFSDLAARRSLPVNTDSIRPAAEAFLGMVARRFFRVTCRMVRRLDPDRLILGVRYAGTPLDAVVAAQAGNTDAVSMNLYIQEGIFPAAAAYRAHRLAKGQPVWVTEFSWHAPYDNRSGDRNTIGFGSRVLRQRSRGAGYRKFVEGAAALPFMIGCDWFQWCDESPKGRGDGEDVNFGLVDIRDRPYGSLLDMVRRTNSRVDRLHAHSENWRPREAIPAPVPYCVAPRLKNGKPARGLSDGREIKGLKFRPSLDALPRRVPVRARAGWRPQGLVFWIEVADAERTVELSKLRSIEWFWMTDAVELLLRPGGESIRNFDKECVKVFAVPDGAGKGRPYMGETGRHKLRLGRRVRARARQIRLPGGYAFMFRVPAGLLGAKALKPWQVLRFNLLVMDCEKVRETYWSSHQGEWTTQRPDGWGRLILAP